MQAEAETEAETAQRRDTIMTSVRLTIKSPSSFMEMVQIREMAVEVTCALSLDCEKVNLCSRFRDPRTTT